jgi:hypothetical protein
MTDRTNVLGIMAAIIGAKDALGADPQRLEAIAREASRLFEQVESIETKRTNDFAQQHIDALRAAGDQRSESAHIADKKF